MSDFTTVFFDGLGFSVDIPSVAFSIGGYDVHWYGIIIAFGFALAVVYGGVTAYKWKMSLDGMTDVLIWGTIFGIVCARLYYVAFEWDYFSQNPGEIIAIWHGGIAIYGGIIGALIGGWIGARIGKIDFANLLDVGSLGLLIGQGIGRWGNFFNQEAFGANSENGLFRMWSVKIRDDIAANQALLLEKGMQVDPDVPVHPTFLYESVWCLALFLILHFVFKKRRKFKGELFLLYGIGYGLERMVVEGLRTDSLYIGSTTIRVSQLLSAVIVVFFTCVLIAMLGKLKKGTLSRRYLLNPPPLPVQACAPTQNYAYTVCASSPQNDFFFSAAQK